MKLQLNNKSGVFAKVSNMILFCLMLVPMIMIYCHFITFSTLNDLEFVSFFNYFKNYHSISSNTFLNLVYSGIYFPVINGYTFSPIVFRSLFLCLVICIFFFVLWNKKIKTQLQTEGVYLFLFTFLSVNLFVIERGTPLGFSLLLIYFYLIINHFLFTINHIGVASYLKTTLLSIVGLLLLGPYYFLLTFIYFFDALIKNNSSNHLYFKFLTGIIAPCLFSIINSTFFSWNFTLFPEFVIDNNTFFNGFMIFSSNPLLEIISCISLICLLFGKSNTLRNNIHFIFGWLLIYLLITILHQYDSRLIVLYFFILQIIFIQGILSVFNAIKQKELKYVDNVVILVLVAYYLFVPLKTITRIFISKQSENSIVLYKEIKSYNELPTNKKNLIVQKTAGEADSLSVIFMGLVQKNPRSDWFENRDVSIICPTKNIDHSKIKTEKDLLRHTIYKLK